MFFLSFASVLLVSPFLSLSSVLLPALIIVSPCPCSQSFGLCSESFYPCSESILPLTHSLPLLRLRPSVLPVGLPPSCPHAEPSSVSAVSLLSLSHGLSFLHSESSFCPHSDSSSFCPHSESSSPFCAHSESASFCPHSESASCCPSQ